MSRRCLVCAAYYPTFLFGMAGRSYFCLDCIDSDRVTDKHRQLAIRISKSASNRRARAAARLARRPIDTGPILRLMAAA